MHRYTLALTLAACACLLVPAAGLPSCTRTALDGLVQSYQLAPELDGDFKDDQSPRLDYRNQIFESFNAEALIRRHLQP